MAVLTRAMIAGDITPIRIPKNCLDVLAQQIVAMVAVENWQTDDLFDWLRQVYAYQQLPKSLFINVLEMLTGRYPADTFRDLRPCISWDRIQNTLYALPGSLRLAIISGGVIPDIGQYGAYLANSPVKLGELEEEFVYETRLGDFIQLGTGKWRVIDIQQDRILLEPAANVPARMPFWKGEYFSRHPHLGHLVGNALHEIYRQLDNASLLSWLKSEFRLDDAAAFAGLQLKTGNCISRHFRMSAQKRRERGYRCSSGSSKIDP